jgi:hypothetical protein
MATNDLEASLRLRPVVNEAARVVPLAGGRVRLSVPLRRPWWARGLRALLPLSEHKNIELDDLSAQILGWCDGRTTLEAMLERHRSRWRLSFFEARGSLLAFFRPLLRNGAIVFLDARGEACPPPLPEPPSGARRSR